MERTTRNNGNVIRYTFDGLDEFAAFAQEQRDRDDHPFPDNKAEPRKFNHYTTWDQAQELARIGWDEGLTNALPIAEDAVDAIEAEHGTFRPEPEYHYHGTRVSVGRAVAGHPKAMVRYRERRTSTTGSVVTLCASVSVSGSVKSDNLIERGAAIVALALALERSGHGTELWVSFDAYNDRTGKRHEVRVKVKGAHDVLDPERIAFAYSHPAMLRQLCLASMHDLPEEHRHALRVGFSYGTPAPPHQDLGDGTVYLPELRTGKGTDDPQRLIRKKLRSIGLLSDDA